jgi:hypothetical protein
MATATLPPEEDQRTNDGIARTPDELEELYSKPALGDGIDSDQAIQDDQSDSGERGLDAAQSFADSKNKPTQVPTLSPIKRNRTTVIVVAIASTILLIGFGFVALLPLKIESMIKNVISHEGGRVENEMQRREEKIALKYLEQRAGVSVGSPVIKNSLLGSLYANYQKAGFEKSLFNERGIKIEKGSAPGRIKLTTPNGVSQQTLDQFGDFLGKDLSSIDARAFFTQAVSDQTNILQVYKRRHLRQYLQNAFGVRRWSIFDKKTGKAASTELDTALDTAVNGPLAEREAGDVACILSDTGCPDNTKDLRENPDGTSLGKVPVTETDIPSACGGKNQSACTSNLTGSSNSPDRSTLQKALSNYGGSTGESIADILDKEVTKKIIGGAVGIGALDLVAHIDDGLWNDKFSAVIQARRATQYADEFAAWATISDQIKAGAASGDEVNAAMQKTDGIEKSQAFDTVFLNEPTKGQPVSPDNKIGGGAAGTSSTISQIYKASPFGQAVHAVSTAYLKTIGGVVKIFSDIVGGIVNAVLGVIPGFHDLTSWLGGNLAKLVNYVLGSVFPTPPVGADLMNGIYGGADVTYNNFNRDTLGAPQVSSAMASILNSEIAQQNLATTSLSQRLFSTDYPSSLVNRLAASMPTTPQAAVSEGGAYIASIFTNPAKFFEGFFASAMAAPATNDPYGVQQYGYSDAQLNEDIQAPTKDVNGDGVIDAKDCPQVTDATQPNLCLLDVATIQAMGAVYDSKNDGGLGSAQ